MHGASDAVLERACVREVAGIFHSRSKFLAAVDALLLAGFDRADINLIADLISVRERLGNVYIAPEELADIPSVPRRPIVEPEDITLAVALGSSILAFVAAIAAALGVLLAQGTIERAFIAALLAGGVAGSLGALLLSRYYARKQKVALDPMMERYGLVLWVRVNSPEREEKAREILRQHHAEAVRVHEIGLEKRVEDIPLSSLRPDPSLGDARLGQS
jgi:hypothetical protein